VSDQRTPDAANASCRSGGSGVHRAREQLSDEARCGAKQGLVVLRSRPGHRSVTPQRAKVSGRRVVDQPERTAATRSLLADQAHAPKRRHRSTASLKVSATLSPSGVIRGQVRNVGSGQRPPRLCRIAAANDAGSTSLATWLRRWCSTPIDTMVVQATSARSPSPPALCPRSPELKLVTPSLQMTIEMSLEVAARCLV
jgi:hypothetical protein